MYVKGCVCFGSYTSKADVIEAVSELQYRPFQRTNTQLALRRMRLDVFDPQGEGRRGDRQFVQNVAIVITDGESNIVSSNTVPQAHLAIEAGITLLPVGVGNLTTDAITEIAVSTFKLLHDRCTVLYMYCS